MRFHADLHIHSKYSRATSKHCDLEHLAFWARRKGIAVVGTGDFTHPAWLAELKDKLVPAEPGLFRLRPDIEQEIERKLPAICRGPVRFMLSVEISTIYKKGERTRKIHHLIYAPDFEAADRMAGRLGRIGNIASDGRPILGLDSRHLLEITLESSPDAYLVPAHIWTPWFAMLGSRSGFDTVTECYGDLAEHIFAVETGLSSDPPMNWRISFLDRYRLVSNSDAHSPAKLGREATLFDTELDYFALRRALETGDGYVGTVEFFPEEGKYHLDGHRKCGTRLTPDETLRNDGRCTVCGEPVTVGVMHRVDALADRPETDAPPPATAGEVMSLVPLPEIISEVSGVGPASQKVERSYDRLVAALGSELSILETVPVEDIGRAESSVLAEAISRLRAGKVIRDAGYDGEYGTIRLFEAEELKRRTVGGLLFDLPAPLVEEPSSDLPERVRSKRQSPETPSPTTPERPSNGAVSGPLADLDPDQRAAAEILRGALLIVAGPGSGKTRTLTHRIAHLVADHGVPANRCLAVTFTRRAAREMTERLDALLPGEAERPAVHTFHSLGHAILREHPGAAGLHRGFRLADEKTRSGALAETLSCSERKAQRLLRAISTAKRGGQPASTEVAEALEAYQGMLSIRSWVDFDDLVGLAVQALDSDPQLAEQLRDRFAWISIDEFQDLDEQQYRLVKLLAPLGANLCVIGDANQAIYGFRGAHASHFNRFQEDYPEAAVVRLTRNYRSSGTIVAAAGQVIAPSTEETSVSEIVRAMQGRIAIHTAPTERAEAEFVVQTIERMIGGHSFFSIDSGRTENGAAAELSFSDFAVLARTDAQSHALSEALARSGMPFRKHSHEPLADRPAIQALMGTLDRPGEGDALRDRLTAAAHRLTGESGAYDAVEIEAGLRDLLNLAATCSNDRERLADAVALASEADCWDPRADAISLLTLHAAKGLEFPVVFVVGLEDGLLPLTWGRRDPAAVEEERRLFYVGMTRAEDALVLSRAVKRRWRGRVRTLEPSPFLADIERELLDHSRADVSRRKDVDRQLELFAGATGGP